MELTHYTIAHISDLHLSPEHHPERSFHFRSVLQDCIDRNVNHIVITGDITHQAKKIEFEEFRQIASEAKVLDGKRLTVVVGNHDVFGAPYRAEELLEFPSICKTTDYQTMLDRFFHQTKETYDGTIRAERTSLYPFVKPVGPVSLVGLNSIARWSPLKNPIGSNGEIDDHQFDLLETLLSDLERRKRRVLILIHHHFCTHREPEGSSNLERLWSAIETSTMKLRKKKRLLTLFRRTGVEGVLHGHVHRTDEYMRKNVRFVNAGGSMIPSRKAHSEFNLIKVNVNGITTATVRLLPSYKNSRRPDSLRRVRGIEAA